MEQDRCKVLGGNGLVQLTRLGDEGLAQVRSNTIEAMVQSC